MIVHESSQGALVVIAGGEAQHFALARDTLTIGRSSLNDICLYWDPRVSRHHARLVLHDGIWILQDLGSTNGTFLETDRIDEPTPIGHGHRIRFGHIWLRVAMDYPVPLRRLPSPSHAAYLDEVAEAEESVFELAGTLALHSAPIAVATEPPAQEHPPDRSPVPAAAASAVLPPRPPVPPPPPPPPAPVPALEPAAVEEPEQSPWLLEFPEGKERETAAPAPEELPVEFTEELDGLFDEPVTAEAGFAPQPEPVLVAAEPTVAAPSAMERAVAKVMESVLSCRESPLEVEIRALATDPSQTPDTHELRQMIADLDIPPHLSAQLRETLGSPDVAIALSAQSGAQGDLLVFAGQVVARLSEMPAYKDVLVTPQDNGH